MMIGDMRRKQQRKKSKLEIKIVLAARVANCINSIKRKRYSLFNYLFEIIFLLSSERGRRKKNKIKILALAIQ